PVDLSGLASRRRGGPRRRRGEHEDLRPTRRRCWREGFRRGDPPRETRPPAPSGRHTRFVLRAAVHARAPADAVRRARLPCGRNLQMHPTERSRRRLRVWARHRTPGLPGRCRRTRALRDAPAWGPRSVQRYPPGKAVNDGRLWHSWLRINRVLRVTLHTRWSAEAWPPVQ